MKYIQKDLSNLKEIPPMINPCLSGNPLEVNTNERYTVGGITNSGYSVRQDHVTFILSYSFKPLVSKKGNYDSVCKLMAADNEYTGNVKKLFDNFAPDLVEDINAHFKVSEVNFKAGGFKLFSDEELPYSPLKRGINIDGLYLMSMGYLSAYYIGFLFSYENTEVSLRLSIKDSKYFLDFDDTLTLKFKS